MRILVDGDGCPSRDKIADVAKTNHIEMLFFCDYSHVVEDMRYTTILVSVGKDSVDYQILKYAKFGDVVITQDYGLAGMLLIKGVYVIHTSGKMIDSDNIDGLLLQRHVSAKNRKQGFKTKHKKRSKEQDTLLIDNLIKLCNQAI